MYKIYTDKTDFKGPPAALGPGDLAPFTPPVQRPCLNI